MINWYYGSSLLKILVEFLIFGRVWSSSYKLSPRSSFIPCFTLPSLVGILLNLASYFSQMTIVFICMFIMKIIFFSLIISSITLEDGIYGMVQPGLCDQLLYYKMEITYYNIDHRMKFYLLGSRKGEKWSEKANKIYNLHKVIHIVIYNIWKLYFIYFLPMVFSDFLSLFLITCHCLGVR